MRFCLNDRGGSDEADWITSGRPRHLDLSARGNPLTFVRAEKSGCIISILRILNSRKWKLFTKIIFTFSASGLRYLPSSWIFPALHYFSSTGRNLQSLFYSLSQKTLTSRLYFTLSYMPDATLTSCLYFPSVECHTNQPSLFHSKSPTANHGKQPPLFEFCSTISSNTQLTTSLFQC